MSSTTSTAGVEQDQPLPLPQPARTPVTLPIHQHDCGQCVAEASRLVREVEDRLTHEVKITEALKRTLFPDKLSTIDGLTVATLYQAGDVEAEVGGDFYDVFEVAPGKTAIVLGDVCGKGLPAAAQVSMVRCMLRYALYRCPEPAQALTELNTVLVDRGLLSDFVTVFAAVFDTATGNLEYVSCGHEPAMIVRRGSPVGIELLLPTGPILGIAIDTPIRSSSKRLAAGDSIIAYTDGLVECGPHRCELLGVSRIIYAIRDLSNEWTAHEVAQKIYAVARGSADQFADDMCLLVCQVSGERK